MGARGRVGRGVIAAASVTLLAAVLAGCGADDGTEVLGVQITRDPSEVTQPGPTPSPSATPSATPSPTPSPTSEPTPTAAPATTAAPQPSPTATAPPPPPPPPSPTPPPTPDPVVLGNVEGDDLSVWQPATEDPDGCCWIELGGGVIDRDDPPGARSVHGTLLDPVPASGDEEPWQRQVRQVTGRGWLQAPSDRGLIARGTFEVVVTYGDAVLTSGTYPIDVALEPGARYDLPLPPAGTVDAEDGLRVTCEVRFTAG